MEHIFDCYGSICSDFFSIILLLKKNFEEKNPNYLNYIIALQVMILLTCVYLTKDVFLSYSGDQLFPLYFNFMVNVLIVFLFSYVYHNLSTLLKQLD